MNLSMPNRTGGEYGSMRGAALLDRKGNEANPGLLTGKDGHGSKAKDLSIASVPRFVTLNPNALESAAAASAFKALGSIYTEQLPLDQISIHAVTDNGIAAASVAPPTVEWKGDAFTHNGLRTDRTKRVIPEPAGLRDLPHSVIMPDIVGSKSDGHQTDTGQIVPMPDLPTSRLVRLSEADIVGNSFTTTDIRPSGLHVGAVKDPATVDINGFPLRVATPNGNPWQVVEEPDGHKRHTVRDPHGKESDLLIPKTLDPESRRVEEKPSTFSLDVIVDATNKELERVNAHKDARSHIKPIQALHEILRRSVSLPRAEASSSTALKGHEVIPPTIDPQNLFVDIVAGFENSHPDFADPMVPAFDNITGTTRARHHSRWQPTAREYFDAAVATILLEREHRQTTAQQTKEQADQTRGEVRGSLRVLLEHRREVGLDRPTGLNGQPRGGIIVDIHMNKSHSVDGVGPTAGISGRELMELTDRIFAPDGSIREGLEGSDTAVAAEVAAHRLLLAKKDIYPNT